MRIHPVPRPRVRPVRERLAQSFDPGNQAQGRQLLQVVEEVLGGAEGALSRAGRDEAGRGRGFGFRRDGDARVVGVGEGVAPWPVGHQVGLSGETLGVLGDGGADG